MTAILNLLLIIIFVCFIAVCVVAYRIYRSFRDVARKFGFKGGEKPHYTQCEPDDEVVFDSRTPDEAQRKIFSKNEGEYVDFEETK